MAARHVTVFGSSKATPGDVEYQQSLRLGRMLAEAGYTVVSGGYGGVMEAVSRGAAEAGGMVIGVTVRPWSERHRPNAWLTREQPALHLFDRLNRLIWPSDAYVAMPGGAGTLGEIALTWNLFQTNSIPARPLILLSEPWRRLFQHMQPALRVDPTDLALLRFVDTVDEVIAVLRNAGPGVTRPAPPAGATPSRPRGRRRGRPSP
jgi:uncharacterized protein (TIGR00730 family)